MRNKWFIAIKKNNGDLFDTSSFIKIESPKGKYYADPFIVKHDDVNYLFFEDYDYKKGVIAYSIVNDDLTVTEPVVALERSYHLSFPYIFEYDDEIYMIPETGNQNRIELHRAVNFPGEWTFEKVLVDNVRASDVTILELNDVFWMFTTYNNNLDDDLLVLHLDSPLNKWEVYGVDTLTHSRPAGNIFIDDDKIIRPVQDSSRLYGYAIVFKEVTIDKENGYSEKVINRIDPTWYSDLIGTHTFNFNEDFIVIDGKMRVEDHE